MSDTLAAAQEGYAILPVRGYLILQIIFIS